jgi:hypothetical protein
MFAQDGSVEEDGGEEPPAGDEDPDAQEEDIPPDFIYEDGKHLRVRCPKYSDVGVPAVEWLFAIMIWRALPVMHLLAC